MNIEEKYYVEIENGTSEKMDLKAKVSSFKTLKFSGDTIRKMVIAPGKKEIWELDFTISSQSPLHRRNIRTPTIDLEVE